MRVSIELQDSMGAQQLEIWVEQWSSAAISMECGGSWGTPVFRDDGMAVVEVENLTLAQVEAIVRPTIDEYNVEVGPEMRISPTYRTFGCQAS